MPQKITPNLWFDTEAEEAARFYISVFKEGRIVNVTRYTEAGPREAGTVMTVEFELDGQRFVGINAGRSSSSTRPSPSPSTVPTRTRSTTTGTRCRPVGRRRCAVG
jgi:predicted 3-demethylubiquinone-9 3-methyltransferase (glyoxalase superfamily)